MIKITPVSLLLTNIDTPSTKEEQDTVRTDNLTVLADEMILQFRHQLKRGKIKLNTTGDFERIIKSIQALRGDTPTVVIENKTADLINPSAVLSNTDKIQAIYEDLYKSMNLSNDKQNSKK